MTNESHSVLYTRVTTDIEARVNQHRAGLGSAFTRKYRCVKLVYLEEFEHLSSAIVREKQIKAGSRTDKLKLIQDLNPDWIDLAEIWERPLPKGDSTERPLKKFLDERSRKSASLERQD